MKQEAFHGVKSRRQRVNDPDGTKRNIIEVATEEFAGKGFSGARVDDIAASHQDQQADDLLLLRRQGRPVHRRPRGGVPQDPQHRGDPGSRASGAREGPAHARRLHLRLPERASGIRAPGDEREHPERRLRCPLEGDPAPERSPSSMPCEDLLVRGQRDGHLPAATWTRSTCTCRSARSAFFNIANRATFSTIFKRDMASPKALDRAARPGGRSSSCAT